MNKRIDDAQLYKGKTAKAWFKLHEVMRRDFRRVLREKEKVVAAGKHLTFQAWQSIGEGDHTAEISPLAIRKFERVLKA